MKFRTCLAPYLLSTTSKLRLQEDASFGKTALSSRTFPAAPILSGGLSPPPSLTDSAPLPGARHEPRSAEQGPPPFPHYQFGAGRRRSPVVRPALRQRRQPFSRKQPRRFHDRRPDPAQRPLPHRGPRQPHRHRRGDQGRQVPCRRQRRRGDAPSRQRHPGDRPAEAHRDPRSQRLAPAPDPRWPQLQPGAALGRSALLADALRMLKNQAERTPSPSGCGWSAAGTSSSSPRSACRPWRN